MKEKQKRTSVSNQRRGILALEYFLCMKKTLVNGDYPFARILIEECPDDVAAYLSQKEGKRQSHSWKYGRF